MWGAQQAPPDVSPAPDGPVLDAVQREVADRPAGSGPLLVVGAPGTGKTTTLVEAVRTRVSRDGLDPDGVLVLAPTRHAAADLRVRLGLRLRRTHGEPLARTPQGLAFALLRRAAARRDTAAPRLLSGAEQDAILAELIAGHAAGDVPGPRWPSSVPAASRRLRGWRDELRDLIMRALERGIEPPALARLGRAHRRPEWTAAAAVYREYLEVTALAAPGAHDPAGLVSAAVHRLEGDGDELRAERARLRLLAVDDAQDLGPASLRLVEVLAAGVPDLLLFADPDAVTQGFRGAEARRVAQLPQQMRTGRGEPAPTVVLPTSWRQDVELRAATARVAARIGVAAGVAHRRPAPGSTVRNATGQNTPGENTPGQTAKTKCTTSPSPAATSAAPPAGLARAPRGATSTVLASANQEAAAVAQVLRAEHLLHATPWESMAVILRSGGASPAAATLRRVLAAAGVPVSLPGPLVPLRDECAVRPLMLALRLALEHVGRLTSGPAVGAGLAAGGPADDQTARRLEELMLSALGGGDRMALRRLSEGLRARERGPGGRRPHDVLLAELFAELLASGTARVADAGSVRRAPVGGAAVPQPLERWAEPARRVARAVGAAALAIRQPEASVEDVLWALWDATGLAERWRAAALAGGPLGAQADRDLDAMVGLFEAAARFVDRWPYAGPEQFLTRLEAQAVPADTLAEHAPRSGSVQVLTPQAALGREWDVVVVAGVQDGVWPDLRPRGSLLGAQALADLVAGYPVGPGPADELAARRAVLDDELRLFHVAVSRARRRLVVTAVHREGQRPSTLLDLVDPPRGGREEARVPAEVPRSHTLSAAVAELRRAVADGSPGASGQGQARRRAAARQLARLAAAGVPGAHPDEWYGLQPLSDDRPLRGDTQPVEVSPSRVETFEHCALRWLLESHGATSGRQATGLGTLVHQVAADCAPRVAELLATSRTRGSTAAVATVLGARLDELWPTLGLRGGWVERAERQRAERMLGKLARYLAEADRTLVAAEQGFTVDVGRARLRGRVDRLERDAAGHLVVVDLKTGGSRPRAGDLRRHPQLGAYQAAVEGGAFPSPPTDPEPGGEAGGALLVQVGGTQVRPGVQRQPPLADDEDPKWAHLLLQRVADGMAGAAFAATPGAHCHACPVSVSCPAQQQGRQVGPWLG